MADFAPNFTPRLKLNYTVQSTRHAFTWRLPIGTDRTELTPFIGKLSAFLDALSDVVWTDWHITGTSFAAGGSDVFLPCADPVDAVGIGDIAGRKLSAKADFAQFVCRGEDGARGSFYVYGTVWNEVNVAAQDFRINNSESAELTVLTGVLNETSPMLVAIDDSNAIWYPYVNTKPNDHWAHKVRRG